MGLYEPPSNTLLYGPANGGKSALGVSSFWDWKRGKHVANGKWIRIGAEDNEALLVPEEYVHTEKGTSLTLTSPLLDDQEFLHQFDLITRKFVADAEAGKYFDVILFDGLSEFDLLYEFTFNQAGGDSENKYAKWESLLGQFFSMLMRLNAKILKCQIIMTARVMEKKKATQSKVGDPGWVDFDYYPSLRGQFRYHLPHYFGNVFYMETVPATLDDGRVVPAHATHVIMGGDYLTKCRWEHNWLKAGLASPLINVMWPTSNRIRPSSQ